ncbi:HlyD family efflux transporter periplasmic adaptor subunit [Archangium lipolyticum]|uniref:HlyD family efflux transporter periplasmic adaptor subunit n=1 Tax=Archangium lipolyticum TaxID=2970465 RepID=UPI002149BE90|nr:HlyD family efflux transporter periplasmic adaptor subunit [Archangium lipolyticum]
MSQDTPSGQAPEAKPAPAPKPSAASVYRKAALDFYRQDRREQGDVLHLSPAWARWTYWLLTVLLLAGLLYCLLGRAHEYASGPAVLRVEGRTDLTVQAPGVVATVEVLPGQRVERGQTLVTFQAQEEADAAARLTREIELHLVRFMRNPSDVAAHQALTTLNAERELALARVEARTLKAPHAGVVGDVRIQPGQYLAAGTRVLSLVEEEAPVSLVAMLPGYYRPFLRPGMPLRVELEGFRYDYRELVIESVGDQVIGPNEVRRFLGPDLADALTLEGSAVLVKARLPSHTFVNEGRVLGYFDGMVARAEARVRTERILTLLFPALKGLLPDDV